MADYIKYLITDAVKDGAKTINEVVNKAGGGKIKIDAEGAALGAYDSISKAIAPTNEQRIEIKENKIKEYQEEISQIQKKTDGQPLTKEQEKEIAKLNEKITKEKNAISETKSKIEKETAEAIKKAQQKASGISEHEAKKQEKISNYQKEIAEIQKKAEGRELTEDEKKDITKLNDKITKTQKSLSTEEMQKAIEENLKSAQSDYLPITIANAAVKNEDEKKLSKAAEKLKKEQDELNKQKEELKKKIDAIEEQKKNGVILSKEQEEALADMKKQYEKFDSTVRRKSIESYIVTTFTDGTLISNLQDSIIADFNAAISGNIVDVLKQNSYGLLTDDLVSAVTQLGQSTPNKNQVIKINTSTKKKLQLDASNLIKNSVKSATDLQIGSIVDSLNSSSIGKILAPSVQKNLTKIQGDTITKITYGAFDLINKNQDIVRAAQYYYTYQQIVLLAENLSFKNISNLLISTAKKIWVRERDKLIKEITSKISISASGVKINL